MRIDALYVIVGLRPARPRFVVTTITPFRARDPYSADAAAPLRMLMFSMSSGFRSCARLPTSAPPVTISVSVPANEEFEIGTPSTTNSGSLALAMEFTPRITILLDPPTVPDCCVTRTPATLPDRLLSTFEPRATASCSVCTMAAE